MSKSPAFRFYPRDYLADPVVTCMTLEDQGAYMRLLCHAWDPPSLDGGEKPPVGHLPNDPEVLAALSGMGTQGEHNTNTTRWNERSAFILRAFHETEDGRFIYQKRMVEEWEKQEEYREAKSRAGKASGKVRRTPREQKVNRRRTDTPTKTNLASAFASADLPPTPRGGNGADQPEQLVLTPSPTPPRDLPQEVFDHWRNVMGHPGAVLDGKRRGLIGKWLESYGVADLQRAIDGCHLSPWHRGENDKNKVYDSLSLILRNAENIERFIGYLSDPTTGPADSDSDLYRFDNE